MGLEFKFPNGLFDFYLSYFSANVTESENFIIVHFDAPIWYCIDI